MGGKSGGTEEVVQKPWKPQKRQLSNVYAGAQDLFNQGPQEYFPGQTYAEMDPLQEQALQQRLAYSQGGLQDLVGGSTGALNSMLTAPDVANNPYVQDWAQAANRRLGEDFQERVMPGIQRNAIAAGGLGGSRQGVAEGIAAGKLAQQMGDQTAQMYNAAYGMGLDQQGRGMALAPQIAQLGFLPGQNQYDIGQIYRAEAQRPIDEEMARYAFNQEAPYTNLQRYSDIIQNNNWGGVQEMPGQQSSPLSGALGGAAIGGSILGLPGAIGGGLLGGLFS